MRNLAIGTSVGSTNISEQQITGVRLIIAYWKRVGILLNEAVDRAIRETENSARAVSRAPFFRNQEAH